MTDPCKDCIVNTMCEVACYKLHPNENPTLTDKSIKRILIKDHSWFKELARYNNDEEKLLKSIKKCLGIDD